MLFLDSEELQANIYFETARRDLDLAIFAFDDGSLFIESDNESESFIDKVIASIKKALQAIRNKISDIINKFRTKDSTKKLEKAIADDPDLANEKVVVPDYKTLEKINEETSKELLKDSGNVEEKMEKYRKQRNKAIAAGATITVTLGALMGYITKSSHTKINNLEKDAEDLKTKLRVKTSQYSKLKTQYDKTKDDNKKLKTDLEIAKANSVTKKVAIKADAIGKDIKKRFKDTGNEIEGLKASASAYIEVLQNAASDVMHAVKEGVTVVTNKNEGTFSKIKAVKNVVSDTTATAAKVATGVSLDETKNSRRAVVADELKTLSDNRKKALNVLKTASASPEKKAKAKEYIAKTNDKFNKLKSQYNALK